MGTHPFAGRYLSKHTFQETAFGKLREVLTKEAQLRVTDRATKTALDALVFDATAQGHRW
jgi:hypothetical protein